MAITLTMPGISRDAYKAVGIAHLYFHALSALQVQMRDDMVGVFFHIDEFAITCTYHHYRPVVYGYESATYRGIWDLPSVDMGFTSPVNVTSLGPVLQIPLQTMLHYPTVRDQVTVDGVKFQIRQVDDDGVGVVSLQLQRAGSAF